MGHVLALSCAVTYCALAFVSPVAGEEDKRLAAGIQDNSFLIEEAYNQESGVVQHIGAFRLQGRDWTSVFVQEWPIGSQKHQFSYLLRYSSLLVDGERNRGLGDAMLNYRYQALSESEHRPAFAPRVSLILPTGDSNRGLGNGSLGYEINLPLSKIVSDRITVHANAGLSSYFDVMGRSPTSPFLGGSAIYAVTRDFNLMLEVLAEWTESVNEMRKIERETSLTVSPGLRSAFNSSAGQLVLGLATPIRFSKGSTDYGALFYVSFEHSFLK